MNKGLPHHHQATISLNWSATFKKQLAAILEATCGPTFGPENDDDPGCYARLIWPEKDPDEEEGEYASLLTRKQVIGDEGSHDWDSPIPCHHRVSSLFPPDDGGGGGFDGPHCGEEGGGDSGWSLVKGRARSSFPDDDDGNGRAPHLIPLAEPEGNDGGWDAALLGDEGAHDWDCPLVFVRGSQKSVLSPLARPFWPDKDEEEQDRAPTQNSDTSLCCVRRLPIFGDEKEDDGSWAYLSISRGREDEEDSPIKARHVSFDPEGDQDEQEDGPFLLVRRPRWTDEDGDGRRLGFGDDADDDPDWRRAPSRASHSSYKRSQLRTTLGEEDDRGGGWRMDRARTHVLFPPEEPDPDGSICSQDPGDGRGSSTRWHHLVGFEPQVHPEQDCSGGRLYRPGHRDTHRLLTGTLLPICGRDDDED